MVQTELIFFLLGLYAYLRLPSHTRIPRYKKKEDKRGNVYLKRVEGESMGLRVNPWKNSTLGKRKSKAPTKVVSDET